ncbi:MAG: nucleotidyltransferase family protein [Congregibacter sp.]|nr:nucleotidyltransferase family protein [Congregibacter sp.]
MNRDPHTNFSEETIVLILAAGRARRYGLDKRGAQVELSQTLLQKTISQYQKLNLRILVCLSARAEDDFLESLLLADSVECLRCSRAEEGMGGTLAQAVTRIGEVPAVLVALGDMPGLMPATISTLLENMHSDCVVYPVFEGLRGHPVLFGRRFLSVLKALGGDSGASKLLAENADSCVAIPVNDPGVLLDVDTPDDLEAMAQLLYARSSAGVSG